VYAVTLRCASFLGLHGRVRPGPGTYAGFTGEPRIAWVRDWSGNDLF